jgi:hypothetical protein
MLGAWIVRIGDAWCHTTRNWQGNLHCRKCRICLAGGAEGRVTTRGSVQAVATFQDVLRFISVALYRIINSHVRRLRRCTANDTLAFETRLKGPIRQTSEGLISAVGADCRIGRIASVARNLDIFQKGEDPFLVVLRM